MIAHRLQTIQEADRVLVLQHGEVKELGTHEELLARRGLYYTLHTLQFQAVTDDETEVIQHEAAGHRPSRAYRFHGGGFRPTVRR